MNQEDLLTLIRSLLKAAGGVLIAHGAMTEGNYELLSGVVLAVVPTIWSFVISRQHKAALVSAAATGVPVVPGPLSPTSAPAADVAVVQAKAGARP
jgi:hypothetical protein